MNKNAFTAGQLVMILITVISFVVIAAVVTKFSVDDDDTAEVLCQESISYRAKTVISINEDDQDDLDLVEGKLKPIPPLCRTIDKKIEGNPPKIKEQIADKMARCWWMFGEGRYEEILHGSTLLPAVYNLDEPDNKCFVCYAILIDEDNFETITSAEFFDYLTKTPRNGVDKDPYYIDYFQSYGGPGGVQLLTNIEPRHAYAITFMAKNKDTIESNWLSWFGKTIGASAGTYATYTAGSAALGACTLATAGLCIVGVGVLGGTTILLTHVAASDLKVLVKEIYGTTDRDLSIIGLDTLESAQENCFDGDLAGK